MFSNLFSFNIALSLKKILKKSPTTILTLCLALSLAVIYYKDNKIDILYGEIYFENLRRDTFIYSLQSMAVNFSNTIINNKDINFFIENVETPYSVISYVLNRYKNENIFRNIPSKIVTELTVFIDKKLQNDKYALDNIKTMQCLQSFLHDINTIMEDYENKYIDIYNQNMSNNDLNAKRSEMKQRIVYEVTGSLYNKTEIFSYFDSMLKYITTCKNEFYRLNFPKNWLF